MGGASELHCLYRVGWLESEWCHGCEFAWAHFQTYHRGTLESQRLAYEIFVEVSSGVPLELGPVPAHQLVLPGFTESQAPAPPEVLAEALRRQLAGCAFSLHQVTEPHPN